MPTDVPGLLEELKRRGVDVSVPGRGRGKRTPIDNMPEVKGPDFIDNMPEVKGPDFIDNMPDVKGPSIDDDTPEAIAEPDRGGRTVTLPATPGRGRVEEIQQLFNSDGSIPSTRELERALKHKKLRGELAVQDALNELARRGVHLKLATEPDESRVIRGQSKEALENFQKGGDPGAFKEAWRKFFPGLPLPRKDGKIDYEGGADDIQIEIDRQKKIEAGKAGAQNITESKVKRINPQSKLEEEVLVRTDKATGRVLGETVLSSQPVSLTEQEGAAQRYAARLAFNQKILTDTEAGGFDPTAIGTTVQKFVPNRFKSEEVQAYNAAKLNWIAAVLRKESGAAIAKKEYNDADGQYFPQDGDSKAVVKQKQALRELAEEEMTKSIGPSAPDRGTPSTTPAAPSITPAVKKSASVKNRAEAEALGPDVEFFTTPDGRTLKNPKFRAAQ